MLTRPKAKPTTRDLFHAWIDVMRRIPWSSLDKAEHPDRWDGRLLIPVLPEIARALGFSGLGQLQNNGRDLAHWLQPARTESLGLPWRDCVGLIDGAPDWLFWHH